jgi:hypothetical protein
VWFDNDWPFDISQVLTVVQTSSRSECYFTLFGCLPLCYLHALHMDTPIFEALVNGSVYEIAIVPYTSITHWNGLRSLLLLCII